MYHNGGQPQPQWYLSPGGGTQRVDSMLASGLASGGAMSGFDPATMAAMTAAAAAAANAAMPLGGYEGDLMPGMMMGTAASLSSSSSLPSSSTGGMQPSSTIVPDVIKSKPHLRKAAGKVWSDTTLDEWGPEDFRLFCGDLGNEVTDELLANAFRRYKSFQKARVVRDKRTGKGRGYGFVSFTEPEDMLQALKDMDRKYVGNRPIRVMKSKWKEREISSDKNKKMTELLTTQPVASKSLKKFKIIKPVTGGKKVTAPAAVASRGRGYRGYHGPRPPPFGTVGTHMPRIVRPPTGSSSGGVDGGGIGE